MTEPCPQCGSRNAPREWQSSIALAHQIEGDEDVTLCSIGCLLRYLNEHGN